MFAVLFEVRPKPEEWDTYLDTAKMLRPELERIDGFIDNVRYRSLTRDGWILSLSTWRDEKSLVRWRTHAAHHAAQERGRDRILLDYHLRVGEFLEDGQARQGLDETVAGEGTMISLTGATMPSSGDKNAAVRLGLDAGAPGLVSWDIFNGVLAPESVILMCTWKTLDDDRRVPASPAETSASRRIVRIVRDYGMFDRREAPQYFPDVRPAR